MVLVRITSCSCSCINHSLDLTLSLCLSACYYYKTLLILLCCRCLSRFAMQSSELRASRVVRSVLIMPTHDSNFITLPTGGSLRWQLLPIFVKNKGKFDFFLFSLFLTCERREISDLRSKHQGQSAAACEG